MQIERIEDWLGLTVVDRDQEKVGKLSDVYFGWGGHDAVAGAIKTGVLGRKVHVVSLTGALAARDHLKLTFSKDQVKNAPQAEPGADLDEPQTSAFADHFGIELPAARLESHQARVARRKRADETAARAGELEREADKKAVQAKEKEREAAALAQERDEAKREAEDARQAAEGP